MIPSYVIKQSWCCNKTILLYVKMRLQGINEAFLLLLRERQGTDIDVSLIAFLMLKMFFVYLTLNTPFFLLRFLYFFLHLCSTFCSSPLQ